MKLFGFEFTRSAHSSIEIAPEALIAHGDIWGIVDKVDSFSRGERPTWLESISVKSNPDRIVVSYRPDEVEESVVGQWLQERWSTEALRSIYDRLT